MNRITLDGGVTVRTFTPAPRGFDPLRASAADLLRHGFPARPDHPQHLERYRQVFGQMKDRFQYVVPEFAVNKSRSRRLPANVIAATNDMHNIWSGAVVFAPATQSFRWIVGEWTIPNVGGSPGHDFYCTSWIGIDGYQSVQSGIDGKVCQAGINMDLTQTGSSMTPSVAPWCEWLPGPEVGIRNFPVSFGDTVIITICTSGIGANEATIFFANRTSGMGTSFILDSPLDANGQRVQLVGDSAEWVVERPFVNGRPALLADYGEVFFSGCQAVLYNSADGSFSEVVNGGTERGIDMFETATSTLLSRGILVADKVIQCVYAAPGTGQL